MKEGVLGFVIGRFEGLGSFDCVDYHRGCADVEYFHDGVVDGVEGGEEVKVTCDEDNKEKLVCFYGDSCDMTKKNEKQTQDEFVSISLLLVSIFHKAECILFL